jgi:hypothetical protein
MSRASTWLLEHKRDVYSQTGEDGIIEKILETIGDNNKWCVEFGAWDGMYLTNTRYLIESKGYSAVFIEADPSKFIELERNYSHLDNVIPINEFVGFGDKDSLDHILSRTPVPHDFDLLSIDIDGNDYHAWNAMLKYRPKVIVVEFNPTIPTSIEFVQPADPSLNQGTSLLSFVALGKEKGYELVCSLAWNAFFVRKEYYPLFEIESNSPEILRTNLDYLSYIFVGFDGQVFLRGRCTLPWHGMSLKESQVQHLPKFLRKFKSNYSPLQRMAFRLFRIAKNPQRLLQSIRKQRNKVTDRTDL